VSRFDPSSQLLSFYLAKHIPAGVQRGQGRLLKYWMEPGMGRWHKKGFKMKLLGAFIAFCQQGLLF
jgi:hypothetical protein